MKHPILTRCIRFALIPLTAVIAFAADTMPEIKVDAEPLRRDAQTSYAPVIEKVTPSVVTISVMGRPMGANQARNPLFDDPFFRRYFGIPEGQEAPKPRNPGKRGKLEQIGLGSGVIVSADGYILTNHHVVAEAEEIVVTLSDGKTEHKARKVASDEGSDIAVIKVEALGLSPATFADSSKIKVGDVAIAIGNPFAVGQSVTSGIVSATGRSRTGINAFAEFIQTDASINPGNSGGALIDAQGRLIGVPTAIYSRSGGNMGIGFAVPANQARSVMQSLIQHGKVLRGFLGIEMQPLNEALAREFGAPGKDGILVANVVAGGGAEKAGIRSGDVITEIDGKKLGDPDELRTTVANMPPGAKVEVRLYRDSKPQNVTVTLAERTAETAAARPAVPVPAKSPDVLDGVTVSDITAETRKRYSIPEEVRGALITKVDAESASAEADIRPGDVVVSIDGRDVKNSDDAVKLSEEVKSKNSVRLRVSRAGQTKFVVVEEKKE